MEDKFIYNPNVVPQNIMPPINENIFDGTWLSQLPEKLKNYNDAVDAWRYSMNYSEVNNKDKYSVLATMSYYPIKKKDIEDQMQMLSFYKIATDNNFDIHYVPRKVIYNEPATIVYWLDGTKTVVKCSEDDIYDPEKGFLLCYMKKVLGNKSAYNKVLHEATKINDEDIKESSSLVDKIGNAFKKAFNN